MIFAIFFTICGLGLCYCMARLIVLISKPIPGKIRITEKEDKYYIEGKYWFLPHWCSMNGYSAGTYIFSEYSNFKDAKKDAEYLIINFNSKKKKVKKKTVKIYKIP